MYFDTFGIGVDNVIFGVEDDTLKLLMVKRSAEPFTNSWALPGGFIWKGETVMACSKRILSEKMHLTGVFLEQLQVFDEPGRDPRAQIFSVACFGLVRKSQLAEMAGRDVSATEWHPVDKLPKLVGFDHGHIIQQAVRHLRKAVLFQPLVFQLLDDQFTLAELQHLYEAILDTTMDKRNFRKKLTAHSFIVAQDAYSNEVKQGKPAQLYAFDNKEFQRQEKRDRFVSIL